MVHGRPRHRCQRPALAAVSYLDHAMTELTQAADDYFGAGERFQPAEEQFKAISGDPGHALDHAMAGVLRTLAAVAQAALAGVDLVMTAMTEALAAAIETIRSCSTRPCPIPLLADLYGRCAANRLTFLGLFALVLAVPANIICMLLFDQAPFPDQQALDRSQALATAGALSQRHRAGDRGTWPGRGQHQRTRQQRGCLGPRPAGWCCRSSTTSSGSASTRSST